MMRILLLLVALAVATPSLALAQTEPRTPDEIIQGLESALAELRLALQPKPPPAPLPGHVKTVQELTAALAKCDGQTITIDASVSYANLTWACPASTPHTLVVGIDSPAMQTLQTGTQAVADGATASVAIYPADGKLPTLTVTGSNVTFKGITFGGGVIDSSTVVLGTPTAVDPLQQPEHVVFDSVEVLAGPGGGFRGFELHSRAVTITRSRVIGYRHKSRDAQAVYVCNGPGPHTIDSNWLEGSGENVLFGGCTTMSQSQHPANAKVLNNYVYKPQTWRPNGTLAALVKNSIECKACDGALIKGNVIDGNWTNGQTGVPILLTPRNQYKQSPWTVVRNVVVEDNRVYNTPNGYGVGILYTDDVGPTQPTTDITIQRNLFRDSPSGIQLVGGVAGKLTIVNNTFPSVKYVLLQFANGMQDAITRVNGFTKVDLAFERNVAKAGEYGAIGQNLTPGVPSLNFYTLPTTTFTSNVLEKFPTGSIPWPAGNELLPAGSLASRFGADWRYTPDATKGW